MNKALLKLTAIGAAITMLLATLMIGGCKDNPTGNRLPQTTGNGENDTSETQILTPENESDILSTPDEEVEQDEQPAATQEDTDIDVPFGDTPVSNEAILQAGQPGSQNQKPDTNSTQPDVQTQPTVEDTTPQSKVTYQDYLDMKTDQERLEFMNSFGDIALFAQWLTQAKAEYEDGSQSATVDNNHGDIGDFLNP